MGDVGGQVPKYRTPCIFVPDQCFIKIYHNIVALELDTTFGSPNSQLSTPVIGSSSNTVEDYWISRLDQSVYNALERPTMSPIEFW